MNHAETVAKDIIETIQGGRMVYQADQSQGQHDFDLFDSDGTLSAVEVTASVNRTLIESYASIKDQRKGGSMIKTKLCRKDWLIHAHVSAKMNLIRARVDEYLATIEAADIERFFAPSDLYNPSVERIYHDLSVVSGSVFPHWKTPGQIGITLSANGGSLNANTVVRAAEAEALKADNRKKLSKLGTDRRHLAVYIDISNSLAWSAITDFEPPVGLPNLPPEITDLWIFTETGAQNEKVVWKSSASLPWSRFILNN